jgi:hypothetical protein
MPKQKKATGSQERLVKIAKIFRFPAEDVRKLKAAALQMGVNETVYAQMALREKFKKDGIE